MNKNDGYTYCRICGNKLISTETECISWFTPDNEPYKSEEYIELDTIDEEFCVRGIYCDTCEKFESLYIDVNCFDDALIYINDKKYY